MLKVLNKTENLSSGGEDWCSFHFTLPGLGPIKRGAAIVHFFFSKFINNILLHSHTYSD